MIDDILEFNKKFVESKGYEKYITNGIKEQMDTITNRYNKWLYLFHISSC